MQVKESVLGEGRRADVDKQRIFQLEEEVRHTLGPHHDTHTHEPGRVASVQATQAGGLMLLSVSCCAGVPSASQGRDGAGPAHLDTHAAARRRTGAHTLRNKFMYAFSCTTHTAGQHIRDLLVSVATTCEVTGGPLLCRTVSRSWRPVSRAETRTAARPRQGGG